MRSYTSFAAHYHLGALRPLAVGLLVAVLAVPATTDFAQQTQDMQSPAMKGTSMDSPSMMQQSPNGARTTPIEPPSADAAGMDAQKLPTLSTHTVSNSLSGDQKILEVLDRFTYGPRPGDLERVRAMGLQAWFQQQMNPDTIDDSALKTRLAAFPAMQLSLGKLMDLYPTNQQIRAALNGHGDMPSGAAAHAIYASQEARYQARKKNKGNKGDKNDDDSTQTDAASESAAAMLALPPDKRFKAICQLTPPQLKELRQSLRGQASEQQLTAGFTPAQIEVLAAFNGPRGVISAEDVQDKLMRDIYSERQLQEVMVDFWLNHFNVYMKKDQQAPYYIAAYERKTIRPFALSSFPLLLRSVATSPAMLTYLDNSESIGPHSPYALGIRRRRGKNGGKDTGLNENYGRELMELHTIGVNGGYTQADVIQVAKAFTGWTVSRRGPQDDQMFASYDPDKHEPGDKIVMGHRIKGYGESEGYAVLDLLANSPQCAHFISTKLAVRFVGDTPPQAMISRMSATYLETHGDIRQVLLAMINSPEFFSRSTYRAKVKTPQDFVVSAVRAVNADVHSTAALATAIASLGMPLYGMQTPNGYSMKNEAWNSTTALVQRMNFALALATNRVQGVTTSYDALLGPDAATMSADEKVRALEARILDVPVSARTQQIIDSQTSIAPTQQVAELRQVSSVNRGRDPLSLQHGGGGGKHAGQNGRGGMGNRGATEPTLQDTQASLAAGLILGSPEFQRR